MATAAARATTQTTQQTPSPTQTRPAASSSPVRAQTTPTKAGGAPFVRLMTARSASAKGAPLSASVRVPLERTLGVDLAAVRVHHDARAAGLVEQSGRGARAFTVGADVFLGRNEEETDLALMAHEVAHVVQQQQGAVMVQRKAAASANDPYEREADRVSAAAVSGRTATVVERTSPRPQFSFVSWVAGAVGDIVGAAINFVRDHARLIPGYDMLAFIIGRDPVTQQPVERNAVNLIRAVMGMWPGGSLIFDALQRYGIIDRVGGWLQEQFAALGLAAGIFKQALDRFVATLGPSDLLDLGGVWDRARRIFSEPIDRAIAFVRNLVVGVLGFIREAVVRPLAKLAEGTRGYPLLKAILGEDPITHEPYPPTPENLIGGFMTLIGQEEKWRYLQESRAIPRVWAWFRQQMTILLGFVRQVPALFVRAWQSLQISDLLDIPGAFNRMREIFGGFITSFVTWAGEAAMQIMMFIFEALAPGAMPVLRRAMSVIRTIIADPIRFVGYLVKAGVQGFRQFSDNIKTHLINGLVGWLTGALTGAGLQLPEKWDLRGILSLVLQILGLTWQNIRQKLVKVMGETAVTVLETTFDIVITLVREGPAAAWQKILEQLSNLQEMVFGQIRDWVAKTVVMQAVIKIATMLNPAGAVIQAIIAIYNTIMFVKERLTQIIQVAEAFFNSIAAIASGAIGAAADKVEQTMGRLVPVVISFLARLIGLGGISDAIKKIIDKIRAPIDRALDKLIEWIATQAKKLAKAVVSGAKKVAAKFMKWWTLRKDFKAADGKSHSLFFSGEGANAVLMVKSDEEAFTEFVKRADAGTDKTKQQAKADGLVIAGKIDTERKKKPSGKTQEEKDDELAKIATQVDKYLIDLTPKTVLLFGKSVPQSYQQDVNTSGVDSVGFGVGMAVKPLTMIKRPAGTAPTGAANKTYEALNQRRVSGGGASFYIKGHLLNQQLGGPGDWKNLVPLSRSGNAQHEQKAESIVKRTVDLAATVEYIVEPKVKSRSDKAGLLKTIANSREDATSKKLKADIVEAEDHVPTELNIKANMLEELPNKTLKQHETFLSIKVANPIPRDFKDYFLATDPKRAPINLSTASKKELEEIPGVGPAIAAEIFKRRPTSGYRSYKELAELVSGIGEKKMAELDASGLVKLFGK